MKSVCKKRTRRSRSSIRKQRRRKLSRSDSKSYSRSTDKRKQRHAEECDKGGSLEAKSDEEVLDWSSVASSEQLPKSKLMSRFEKRLRGGHFRFINQGLYLSTGKDSLSLFKKNPYLFEDYHSGYIQSMQQWSVHPVDVAIRWLRKQKGQQNVVDYGCGEAKIARADLSHNVTSLDLFSLHPRVISCDMTHSPLSNHSQDIAIFSLSLMGTDYYQCLMDAARTLKINGLLWIAEVCSRFADRDGKEEYHAFLDGLQLLGFERVLAKKPSSLFVVFVLKKTNEPDRKVHIQWPVLKPCLYKKR